MTSPSETSMPVSRRPMSFLRGALFVVALGAVGLLGGCDEDNGCLDTQVQVSWHLVQDGVDVECLPGDTVSVRVDTDRMTADFPCSAGVGITPPVAGGVVHNVSLVLSDAEGNVLSQTADMGLGVACGATTVAPEVEFRL